MQTFASLIWSLFTNMFDLKFLITLYITYDKDQKSCMKISFPISSGFPFAASESCRYTFWVGGWLMGDGTKLSLEMTQNWVGGWHKIGYDSFYTFPGNLRFSGHLTLEKGREDASFLLGESRRGESGQVTLDEGGRYITNDKRCVGNNQL